MGSYLPALQQVSERDPLPLAKTCSSCQSTPCGPHVVGRQMDSDFEPWFFTFPARPSDSLPAHHPTHSIGSNCRYAELSVKSPDTNDVLGPLGRADIQRPESHSPGELGSGRPSGLFKRRSRIWEKVALGFAPRLTAEILFFPLSSPALLTLREGPSVSTAYFYPALPSLFLHTSCPPAILPSKQHPWSLGQALGLQRMLT